MITLNDIRLNNLQNKTYLKFEDSITFKDNTIYFIIGRSGVGKTSLVDFMTAPFTNDPIKNGIIELSNIISDNDNPNTMYPFEIKGSYNVNSNKYVNFMRKSVAFIPQKTDSFHPSIPVVKQMYNYYKMVLPKRYKPNHKDFYKLLEENSTYAGWGKVTINPKNKNRLLIHDKKEYIDEETGDKYIIINKNSENEKKQRKDLGKIYEREFSTGQLQRLLILMGLIQFDISEHPLLIADEFLVNFSYLEANEVLKMIINKFKAKKTKHKIGIFILHDLSFEFLKSLINDSSINIEIIGIEKKYNNINENEKDKKIRLLYETASCQNIIAHKISFFDFWNENIKLYEFFKIFKDSYSSRALTDQECKLNLNSFENNSLYDTIKLNESEGRIKEENLFTGNIELSLNKNRIIVLTGFSGCGKSTICKLYIKKNNNKFTFRYFPDKSLSSLSEDSQVVIKDDLLIMYNYYNHINNLNDCKNDIERIIKEVNFYEGINDKTKIDVDDFIDKQIYDLSGGQLQRYWFARLFLNLENDINYKKPELFILDESIASLDCITKDKIISFILKQIFDNEATMLFVSHDLRDIGVIYQTLSEIANKNKINIKNIFEHYEMFDGNLNRVETTNFNEYCNNLYNGKPNTYYSLNKKKILKLRLIKGDKL